MGAIAKSTRSGKVCDCVIEFYSQCKEKVECKAWQGPNVGTGRQKNGQLKCLPGQVARIVWGIGRRVSVFIKDFGAVSRYFVGELTFLL